MHPKYLEALVASVRQRVKEADCPTSPPLAVGVLEEMVVELAAALATAQADMREKCAAKVEEFTDDILAPFIAEDIRALPLAGAALKGAAP